MPGREAATLILDRDRILANLVHQNEKPNEHSDLYQERYPFISTLKFVHLSGRNKVNRLDKHELERPLRVQ